MTEKNTPEERCACPPATAAWPWGLVCPVHGPVPAPLADGGKTMECGHVRCYSAESVEAIARARDTEITVLRARVAELERVIEAEASIHEMGGYTARAKNLRDSLSKAKVSG